MVVVETSVWIDFFNRKVTPQTQWLSANLTVERLGITDLIFCEVLQGIRDDIIFAKIRTTLLSLEIIPSGGILLALASAQNYRLLRKKGITVRKTVDCLTATVCIQQNFKLLHNDRDFMPFQEQLTLQAVDC